MRKKVTKKLKEKTVQRVRKNRRVDYIFLRDVVKGKLKWARQEHIKITEYLKQLEIKTNYAKENLLKVEGIAIVLAELEKMEPENKKVGDK